LVVEAVERLVDYDSWFLSEVDEGLAEIESDRTSSHEQVGSLIRKTNS
jgi:predicted transcriptional regulator